MRRFEDWPILIPMPQGMDRWYPGRPDLLDRLSRYLRGVAPDDPFMRALVHADRQRWQDDWEAMMLESVGLKATYPMPWRASPPSARPATPDR